MKDNELRKRILSKADVYLDTVIQLCKVLETAASQAEAFDSKNKSNAIYKNKLGERKQVNTRPNSSENINARNVEKHTKKEAVRHTEKLVIYAKEAITMQKCTQHRKITVHKKAIIQRIQHRKTITHKKKHIQRTQYIISKKMNRKSIQR